MEDKNRNNKPRISWTIEHDITLDQNGEKHVDEYAFITGLTVPKDLQGKGYAMPLTKLKQNTPPWKFS